MGGRVRCAFLVCVALLPALAGGEPLAREDVPEPLEPWVDWVLLDHEDAVCPSVHGDAQRRQCVWPSHLSLELTTSGGRFHQQWRTHRRLWVPLPGDAGFWPQDVAANGAPALVVARGGVPSVQLEAGLHRVTGRFQASELPDSLAIPAETGLVTLTRLGERVTEPDRDQSGRLWLRRQRDEAEGETRLDVIVHRRVIDTLPLQLETHIELRVSGPAREVLLGQALLPGYVAMALDAPLPARIEPDGRLRAQVRPGTWQLQLRARSREAPVAEIALGDTGEPWDADEVWVFEGRSDLRVADVQGVEAVDPQQTRLPDAWKHLPAYLMEAGSRMQLVTRRRGDADPAPDQLTLVRRFWLDFDGNGYTVSDRLSGTLSRSWRLEVAPPMELGRVAIDGKDQFLSRLEDDAAAGVEVRQGRLELEADSRMNGVRGRIPATGWRHDFQRVSGTLHLPPGWRLFHASGVDDLDTTWIRHWSLLDIFLVLVTTMIVGQLFGRSWGGVAFAALVLTYPEPGAARYVWLLVLATIGLLRVVPEGRFRTSMTLARVVALTLLVLVTLPFLVQQARLALHPALERPHDVLSGSGAAGFSAEPSLMRAAKQPAASPERGMREVEADLRELSDEEWSGERKAPRRRSSSMGRAKLHAPDPAARVSTGPGLPQWAWNQVELSWRGPVDHTQEISLWLLPPFLNFILAWLRVGLTAALLVCLLGVGEFRRLLPLRQGVVAPLLFVTLLATTALPARADDIPSPELLDQLRTRLLEPPACAPLCAASPRMRIAVSSGELHLRLEVDAATATAVPLPGGLKTWVPQSVTLDGSAAEALARDPSGNLWVSVAAGKHQILLEGPLPDRDAVQLPLPLRPYRVEVERIEGWTLNGVRSSGVPEGSLELSRQRDSDDDLTTLEAQDLPFFVEVERTLLLGLTWEVATRVRRLTPAGRALFVEIPLLAGESVTTDSIEVEDDRALVRMPPGVREIAWSSALSASDGIVLRSADTLDWAEVWRLEASPMWHVEPDGVPPLHEGGAPAIRAREWRPWPGEELALAISRPAGIDGRTLTIDRMSLSLRPGLRSSESTLLLELRSSRGGQHRIVLPTGAELQSVEFGGRAEPLRALDGVVTLPIRPGKHVVRLVWRSPVPMSLLYTTPQFDPGAPVVNAGLSIDVPGDRWTLLVGGPRVGPAVLFWSVLVISLLASLGLSRLPLTPLSWVSWLLLLVGMTQVPVAATLVVVGWLLLLGLRRDAGARASTPLAFDGMQVLLAGFSLLALGLLLWAVQQGLLGTPDMQIRGNGSHGGRLAWYQDRSDEAIPTAWMISLPLYVYRLAMLAWALWLARALVGWLRWGWSCFSADELWRPLRRSRQPVRPDPSES
jgi:hypothetical protein